jgi:uncharacterized protein YwgA
MAKAIRKEIKLFIESFDHIHTNNILMEENQTLTQETMFEKIMNTSRRETRTSTKIKQI